MKKLFSKPWAVTVLVIALGTVFVAVGVLRGESGDVLAKAVNICLECVGIG